jgi:hypothetical protein
VQVRDCVLVERAADLAVAAGPLVGQGLDVAGWRQLEQRVSACVARLRPPSGAPPRGDRRVGKMVGDLGRLEQLTGEPLELDRPRRLVLVVEAAGRAQNGSRAGDGAAVGAECVRESPV